MGDKKLISSSSSSASGYDTTRNNHLHHHHLHHPPPSSSDEISLFLRHIFYRSSPLPSYYSPAMTAASTGAHGEDPHADNSRCFLSPPPPPSNVIIGGSGSCFGFSCGGNNAQVNSSGTRVSTASGNETDEYDCESEEAVVDELSSKFVTSSRSPSKRCRAADVHNMSEKRRRSRINEKMKALQSLIPSSNKTDKASMLDEAIEYLKQLQLQVQILTMRNGINLNPLCLPGSSLSQLRPEATNVQFGSTSNAPELMNNVALEHSIRSHFGPFPLFTSPVDREGGLTHQRLNIGHSNIDLAGEHDPFDGTESDLKDRMT